MEESSHWETRKKALKAQGLSPEEAEKQLWNELNYDAVLNGLTGFLTSGTLSVAGYGAGKASVRKTVAALAPDDPKIKGSGILAKYQRDIISFDNLKAAYAEAEAYGSTPEQLARIEEKIQKQEAALEAQEASTELTRVLEADGLGAGVTDSVGAALKDWDEVKSEQQGTILKWENGFSNFPEGDALRYNAMQVPPMDGYFDVGMHGGPERVGFGTKGSNMRARQLAQIIKHMEHYQGQNIRLLSCSTGNWRKADRTFAQELANALGKEVIAPTQTLYINGEGKMLITDNKELAELWDKHGWDITNTGRWESYTPGKE